MWVTLYILTKSFTVSLAAELTFSSLIRPSLTAKADRNIPKKAKTPPTKAVFRIPNLSTKRLEGAESKNVMPTANDPTKAALEEASEEFCCS